VAESAGRLREELVRWHISWMACKYLVDLLINRCIFTALHVMQMRYCDENSVCPSVCLSVCHTRVLWQNGRKICPDLYTIRKNI